GLSNPGTLFRHVTGGTPEPIGDFSTNEIVALGDGSHVAVVGCDAALGCELRRSDGTASGTTVVADLAPGQDSPSARNLVAGDTVVFFTTELSGTGDEELWASDLTESGTVQLGPV
ncbi:MAG: hypothetical protein AAGG08_15380, partial [Actinomycetota bacterium]